MGVSLEYWGAKKREWEALETKQLMHLFSLEMSEQERLILTLLITTGMRLDEVCLLRWEQIKKDKNGIRFIDLSMNPIKNDKFSKRNVAIPDVIGGAILGHSSGDIVLSRAA
jgi:integrase